MKRCKNWAHKIFSWKYLTIWRLVLPVFPEHRVPPSWAPPWAPFRGFWGSAAAVAHVLLHVEADGKCQTSVHIPLKLFLPRSPVTLILLNSMGRVFFGYVQGMRKFLVTRDWTWAIAVTGDATVCQRRTPNGQFLVLVSLNLSASFNIIDYFLLFEGEHHSLLFFLTSDWLLLLNLLCWILFPFLTSK